VALTYPHLFKPLKLGRTLFPNRIFSSPQDIYRLTAEGFLDEAATAFYELKAFGGHGAVTVGDFFVAREARSHLFQLVGDDIRARKSLTRTANALRRHGAAAGVELNHAGKNARMLLETQDFLWGVADGEQADGTPIRQMSGEQVEAIIEQYVQAAAFAVRCGFNFICVHAGHGWLPAQFLSPSENTRTDTWGGSFENRMRFLLTLLKALHQRIGRHIPIEVRLSGREAIAHGMELDDAIAISRELDGLADIIHLSAGYHESPAASMVSHPPFYAPEGVNLHYAVEVKKHLSRSLVSTVGAFTDPAFMEEVLASGQVDIINLGRQTLADPFLPYKARTGRADEINRCLRCMTCFSTSTASGIFYCATNPVIGHERDSLNETPGPLRRRVLVAGGGVGGMQAALTAAERGHEVILVEKADRLGGVLNTERAVPFKDKVGAYLDTQIRKIARRNIELRLNTVVTPELIGQIAPDALIVAFGARPIKPPIRGIDGAEVYSAEEIFADSSRAGRRVVILGGGLVGLELGLYLASEGAGGADGVTGAGSVASEGAGGADANAGEAGTTRTVSILEMSDIALPMMAALDTSEMINHPELLSPGVNIVHGIAIGEMMKRYSTLSLHLSTRALEIEEKGVRVAGPRGERLIEADTVVYAVGQKALDDEALALYGLAPEFSVIGDCVTPGSIIDATQAAYQAARDIGRL
jgi:2,4-dienoyl-CoA reductase-like NADH-dependent reductase (Old Yellow Enzyme family)/NADPH-dependent 2,4-dienoyl-CoA reductase/sulfur reductase-like enzyme